MILVRFIHDGKHKGWRYKEGDQVLLADPLAKLAIDEGMAITVQDRKQVSRPSSLRSVDEARQRSLT